MAACICLQVWKATNRGPDFTQHPSDITPYCARFTLGKPQTTLTMSQETHVLGRGSVGLFFFMSVHICPIQSVQMTQGESEPTHSTQGHVSKRSSHSPVSGSHALAQSNAVAAPLSNMLSCHSLPPFFCQSELPPLSFNGQSILC